MYFIDTTKYSDKNYVHSDFPRSILPRNYLMFENSRAELKLLIYGKVEFTSHQRGIARLCASSTCRPCVMNGNLAHSSPDFSGLALVTHSA